MARANIVNGPSKWDLSVALFHRPSSNRSEETLSFTLDNRTAPLFILRGVKMEDDSHESWILTGDLVTGRGRFIAHYKTTTRTGFIELLAD